MIKCVANFIALLLALVLATTVIQILISIGNSASAAESEEWPVFGNAFAWKFILCVCAWAQFWLWIPSKTYSGPSTTFGYVPIYKENGTKYYFSTLFLLASIIAWDSGFSTSVYTNAAAVLGALNVFAIVLSILLLFHSKIKSHEEIDPYLKQKRDTWLIYEFYRGMDLHPRYLGVDVKQLVIVRIGLMLWQVLVIIYFVAGYERRGLDIGHLVNVVLQSVYLYRFFKSETSYFNTLDITLDRMGFYMCWGSLVGFPGLYTFSTYYFVHHETNCDPFFGIITLLLGLAAIYYKYDVDSQKQVFRDSETEYLKKWNINPEFVSAKYRMEDGSTKETKLLVSGWWGKGRKINYSFELLSALCWSIPAGFNYGHWPFIYFIFLCVLLFHRIRRDEVKCSVKYGNSWNHYCKNVPYRLIPGIY